MTTSIEAVGSRSDDNRLSRREFEVLLLLRKGYTNKEIAGSLVIEMGTVKNHVHNILRKLQVVSRHQAAEYYRASVFSEGTKFVLTGHPQGLDPVVQGMLGLYVNSRDINDMHVRTGVPYPALYAATVRTLAVVSEEVSFPLHPNSPSVRHDLVKLGVIRPVSSRANVVE